MVNTFNQVLRNCLKRIASIDNLTMGNQLDIVACRKERKTGIAHRKQEGLAITSLGRLKSHQLSKLIYF